MDGILQDVTADPLGSSLTADAALGATVLSLDSILDFDEDGGQVIVGDETYDYDSMDPDAATITLATGGLLAAAVTGDPVEIAATTGGPARDWIAWVEIPDSAAPIPATVPLGLIDQFPPGADQAGSVVPLERDGEGYRVLSKASELPEPPAGVEAPTSVLTVTAVGDENGITAVAQGGIAPTSTLKWYLDGVLREETRSAVVHWTTRTEGGTDLLTDEADGTLYAITVQESNSVDDGPLSDPAHTTLNPAVSSQVVLGWVAAGFILAGTIQVGTAMVFDSEDGITITHPDGRQTYMRADGSGNQFIGQATLDAATILGALTILGQTNQLNGLLTMAAGVPDPTNLPAVTSAGWDFVASGSSYGYAPRGLFDNGTTWLYTDSISTAGNVNSINKSTGARSLLFSLPSGFTGVGGVVKVGTSYYVLGRDYSGARGGNWYVYVFNASFVKTGEWAPAGFNSTFECAIGVDGSSVLITDRQPGPGNLYVHTWTTAGVNTAGLNLGSIPTSFSPTGVLKVAVDTATVRFVVASLNEIRVFNTTTAARVASEEWTPAAAQLCGLSTDGTNFSTLHGSGLHSTNDRVSKYTNLIGTWDFAYDWADNDTAGTSGAGTGLGGANTARTKKSSVRSFAPLKRTKWTIGLPSAPPDDGTSDGANTGDLYAAPTGNTLVLQAQLATSPAVGGTPIALSATFSTLALSGTAPSATSGFAARPGVLGRLLAAGLDVYGTPMIDVAGAGGGHVGPYRYDASGVVSGGVGEHLESVSSGDANPTSTTNVTIPGLSISLTSPGAAAVWEVVIDADVQINIGGTINIVELLVDGSAMSVALTTRVATAVARIGGSKRWRITGLTAGAHTLSARTRNTAASTDGNVRGGQTVMTSTRKM